jgi:hypothetical protein
MWKSSFVATAVTLGATLDEALEAIGGSLEMEVACGLASHERSVRLTTLSRALHGVAQAVEEVRLA